MSSSLKHNSKFSHAVPATATAKAASKQGNAPVKHTVPSLIRLVKASLASTEELQRRRRRALEAYLDTKTDTKELDSLIRDQESVLAMARASVVSLVGNRAFKIRLPISYTASTDASGVLSAVTNVDPTASVEWSSLAALFDEYKVVGGTVSYVVTAASAQFTATAASANVMHVLAFDPIEGTPLTSTRNGAEMAHHKLSGAPATNGTLVTQFSGTGHPLEFRFKLPSGPALNEVSNVVVGVSGQWYPTISTSNVVYWGYLKRYLATVYTSATVAETGIIYMHVEFRCRS